MEFYFRKDGQNLGPLSIFRVRDLLESGGLTPQDQGWHEGMEEWKPLSEIPALQGVPGSGNEAAPEAEGEDDFLPDEFYAGPAEKLPTDGEEAALDHPPRHLSPALAMAHTRLLLQARQGQAWRRFFARWIDFLLAWLILTPLPIWLGWVELGELMLPRVIVVLAVPFLWIFLEAICLRLWGRTPGKALLGLQVTTMEGEPLSWRQSFSRSFDVWLIGCGIELPILSVMLKFMAMVRFRQLGETSWDAALKLKVVYRPIPVGGIVMGVILIVLTLGSWVYAFYNSPLPSHLDAEERQIYERWHTLPQTTSGPTKPNVAQQTPAQPHRSS